METAGGTLGAICPKSKDAATQHELIRIIRREIESAGAITFARFMELALYHPQHGYYSSGRATIGRKGDYFTNVSVGPVFGQLLAIQFRDIWRKLNCADDFTIVEQGAHDGEFATDVLNVLRELEPACFAKLRYIIVEPFPIARTRQQKALAEFSDKISWAKSVDDLEPFCGVHFSNELFDSLPVHLFEFANDKWMELFVLSHDNGFAFEARPRSGVLRPPKFNSSAVTSALLSAGSNRRYQTELHLAAAKLMREIAGKLQRGVILTIDYGFTRAEYYSSDRCEGTLQVRAAHRKLPSPFEQIGAADISAHVEWTSLAQAGESAGASLLAFTDQHHFLTALLGSLSPLNTSELRQLQTLLHPEMLGRSFQVLALGKDFNAPLDGFRFARDPRQTLGLLP